MYLFANSVLFSLCVSISTTKLTKKNYKKYPLSFLKFIILFPAFYLIITIIEVSFLVGFLTGIGILAAVFLTFAELDNFLSKDTPTLAYMRTLIKITCAIYIFYIGDMKMYLSENIDRHSIMNIVTLTSLYAPPLAVALLYRRKDPKYNAALPYKFIAGSIMIMALCLLLPFIDVLVAKHGAG